MSFAEILRRLVMTMRNELYKGLKLGGVYISSRDSIISNRAHYNFFFEYPADYNIADKCVDGIRACVRKAIRDTISIQ
jgi:predicted DNA-binding protein (UPF0278 family)